MQNFIFNIWGSREGELAKSHILHSNELIQVLKWQNYGEEASKQCQISQLWQLWLSRHLSLPIPFVVLSPRLPSSPTPTIQLQQGLAYFSMTRHVGWTPRIIYSLSTFDFSAKRSLKTHALMTKDFYLWHGNSNNFHMPCSLSYFTYLRYVPNSIELCHGFIECHDGDGTGWALSWNVLNGGACQDGMGALRGFTLNYTPFRSQNRLLR